MHTYARVRRKHCIAGRRGGAHKQRGEDAARPKTITLALSQTCILNPRAFRNCSGAGAAAGAAADAAAGAAAVDAVAAVAGAGAGGAAGAAACGAPGGGAAVAGAILGVGGERGG